MKRGTTQSLRISLNVDLAAVDSIIFTVKATADMDAPILLQKHYPQDTTTLDGELYLTFTQEETTLFTDYICIEGQVNFVNHAVGKTSIIRKMVAPTLFTSFLLDNSPDPQQAETIPATFDGDVVIVRGIDGKDGVDGKDGAPGAPGRDGINGGDGAPGPMGPVGPQGERGLQGDRGEKGDTGVQGLPGRDGAQGVPGAKGERGLQGDKGDKGDTGAQGLPGKDGVNGRDGAQGIQGLPGAAGEKGDRGEPGGDYVLTELDKQEIAGLVEVDAPTKAEFTEANAVMQAQIDAANTAITTHVHPAQTFLPYAENGWNEPPAQLVPDTNTWKLKWGGTIHSSGNYALDITFSQKWYAYTYEYTADEVIALRGKTIEIGVATMVAPTGKLELTVDDSSAMSLSPSKLSDRYTVPITATTMALRAVVYDEILSMSFTGLYVHLVSTTPEPPIDFTVRKILQSKLGTTITMPGTIVITETGGLYLSKGNAGYLPLAGTPQGGE